MKYKKLNDDGHRFRIFSGRDARNLNAKVNDRLFLFCGEKTVQKTRLFH